jgi:hypothetical protein
MFVIVSLRRDPSRTLSEVVQNHYIFPLCSGAYGCVNRSWIPIVMARLLNTEPVNSPPRHNVKTMGPIRSRSKYLDEGLSARLHIFTGKAFPGDYFSEVSSMRLIMSSSPAAPEVVRTQAGVCRSVCYKESRCVAFKDGWCCSDSSPVPVERFSLMTDHQVSQGGRLP